MHPIKNNKIVILSLILVLLTIISVTFLPSLNNDFTNWDDPHYLHNNPLIRDLSRKGIFKIFTTIHYSLYKPLVFLSFAIEYHFFKLNLRAYHTTNLVFHLLNSLLVFWLFYLLSKKIVVSFLVAILFGIHPLHVESVAWISERKDMLYGFFFLAAIIAYYYYKKNKVRKYSYLAIIFFILSLCAKPQGIGLPLILVLCDYLQNRQLDKDLIKEKIPLFLIAIFSGVISMYIYHVVDKGRYLDKRYFTILEHVFILSYGLLFYLYKMFVPIRLSCLYPFPQKTEGIFLFEFLLLVLLLICLIYLVILSQRYTKKIVFGGLFFIIMVLPTLLNLYSNPALVADRYTYISLIGIFYIIAESVFWLYTKLKFQNRIITVFSGVILIGIIVTLSILSWQRCKVWKDGVALWTDAINKYPNLPMVYFKRGSAYTYMGRYAEALSDYEKSLSLRRGIPLNNSGSLKSSTTSNQPLLTKEDFAKRYNDLAIMFQSICEYYGAISLAKQATLIVPSYPETYNTLAVIFGIIGNYPNAIYFSQKAIELKPDFSAAYYNLAVAYYYQRQYDLASRHIQKAIELGFKVNPEFLKLLEEKRDG